MSPSISVTLRESPPTDAWFAALAENLMPMHPARFPVWGKILETAFRQKCYTVEAEIAGRPAGVLPMVFMKSMLFGKFLIGQPYLNVGGTLVPDSEMAEDVNHRLIDEAVKLADTLGVRYLELRGEREISHPALNFKRTSKVLMRLELPADEEELWKKLETKLQIF